MYKQIFNNIDFSAKPPENYEYENCTFNNCTFNSIKGITFNDCEFNNCNLSNANIDVSILNDCTFNDCKLVGLNFNRVKDFGFCITTNNCNLSYATFERKKLNKSKFNDCLMKGGNFTQTDLSSSIISNCDFTEALFEQTNIEGVDFTTNINFLIDPSINKVKKTKFSRHHLSGLLYRYPIIIE
jgi:fluoroquinolone resistance protein